MIAVVVLREFEFAGRWVKPGDVVDLEPLDAAIRAHRGEISLNHDAQLYRTRVMEPEPIPVQVAVTPSQPSPRRRGRPRKVTH